MQARRRRAGRDRDREPDLRRQSARNDRRARERRAGAAAGRRPPAAPGYGPQGTPGAGQPRAPNAPPDPAKDFVAAVLGDTEDVWKAVFQAMGARYEPPRLVLFRGATQSACGHASAATGPFYCSADRELYLDTAFFGELSRRFGAPGDFAQAYVIAHEVGHHVQNLTGTMRQGRSADAATRRARTQCAVRAPRAAGRLLCRHLGLFRAAPQQARGRATSRKASAPRRPSATTRSRSGRRATSCPSRSRTAPRSSGCAGSGPGSNRATCGAATRSA